MKKIVNNYSKIIGRLILGLLMIFLPVAYVLSNPTQRLKNISNQTLKKIKPDSNDGSQRLDKYKLVFPNDFIFVGTNRRGTVGDEETDRQSSIRLATFFSQINELGEKGYRLVSVITATPYALLMLDEGRYEYDWFETKSSFFFNKGDDFNEKRIEMAKKGFRVVAHFFISQSCQKFDPNDSAGGESCEFRDMFIVEKSKDIKKPIEQASVYSIPGWGDKSKNILEERIFEKIKEGFYPTLALSKYEVLLDKAKEADEFLNDKPDVKVVTSFWGRGSIDDKVNELGKQGYRIAIAEGGIVIMYRTSQTPQNPVSMMLPNVKTEIRSI